MGAQLSEWYFGAGGLLLSEEARTTYFALMEGLRLAVAAKHEPVTGTIGDHRLEMSAMLIKKYRRELANAKAAAHPVFVKLDNLEPVKDDNLACYKFGVPLDGASTAKKFKDFVLIQQLASRFRTALTEDIRSRKAPGAQEADATPALPAAADAGSSAEPDTPRTPDRPSPTPS